MNVEKGITRTCLGLARTDDEEKTMALKRGAILRGSSKGGYKARGHHDDDATEGMLREVALRSTFQALAAIHHRTGRGYQSTRSRDQAGAISSWLKGQDCPLKFDTVIPFFMLEDGTPGRRCIDAFIQRRKYRKGVHFHIVRDVGYVFHTATPFGEEDNREFADVAEFKLPLKLLEMPVNFCAAWVIKKTLRLDGAAVRYQVRETTRRIVRVHDDDPQEDEGGRRVMQLLRSLPDDDLGVKEIKPKCEELYDKARALGFDATAGRQRGKGAAGGMLKSCWAAELLRLSKHARLRPHIAWELYEGSSAAMCCAEPTWPATLMEPNFTVQPGRPVKEHSYGDGAAAAADDALPAAYESPEDYVDLGGNFAGARRRRMQRRQERRHRSYAREREDVGAEGERSSTAAAAAVAVGVDDSHDLQARAADYADLGSNFATARRRRIQLRQERRHRSYARAQQPCDVRPAVPDITVCVAPPGVPARELQQRQQQQTMELDDDLPIGIFAQQQGGRISWISQTCEGFHPLTHSALERVDRNGKDSRDTFVLHPWRHSPHGVSLASFR